MTTIPCTPCCSVPLTTNIPGIQGNAGTAGDDGISAYAITGGALPITIPAVGFTVDVDFSGPGTTPTDWMVQGAVVIIGQGPNLALANPGPATFLIDSVLSPTSARLQALGAPGDAVNPATIDIGALCAPAGYPGVNDVSALTTTSLTGILTGDGANVGSVADPLPIANGGTGASTAVDATKALKTTYRLLAKVTAANFNITTDQAIANLPSKWIIRRIIVQNASINMTTAAGGFYTGAGKTGTVIVAAAQTYAALTGSTIWMDLTLAAGVLTGTAALAVTTIYFALTTAQGAAATADIYIFGEDLS